jgi:ATP-dependent exoDNAse (exonuclease V) beta subunit
MATGDVESIEEERRLFYVAVTRARQALEINLPLRYYHRRRGLDDGHSYAQASRFLSTAVRAHLDHDHIDRPPPSGGDLVSPDDHGGEGLTAIDTALSALWA